MIYEATEVRIKGSRIAVINGDDIKYFDATESYDEVEIIESVASDYDLLCLGLMSEYTFRAKCKAEQEIRDAADRKLREEQQARDSAYQQELFDGYIRANWDAIKAKYEPQQFPQPYKIEELR